MLKQKGLTNLKDMIVKVIALVDKGANNKKLFLFKNEKGKTMNKDTAITILKAGNLDEEQVKEVLAQFDEDEQKEILKEAGVDVEKAGAKFNKEALAALNSIKTAIDKLLDKSTPAVKEDDKDKDKDVKKEDKDDPEMTDEEIEKMVQSEFGIEFLGEERPKTKVEEILVDSIKKLVGNNSQN